MELSEAGLRQQPFRTHGTPVAVVSYAAQTAALDFLATTCADDHGLGLFQGPPLSGKTTTIGQFTQSLAEGRAIAVVDGAGIETQALLETVLSQFGYDLKFDTVNESLNMLKVFAVQQTVSNHAPLLVVENTHAMHPAALSMLCELVLLKVHERSALRLILASDRSLAAIIKAPAMANIAARMTGSFFIKPLADFETRNYVYEKLWAAGCPAPNTVFPPDTCLELHVASGGWPGLVDRLAQRALGAAAKCPIGRSAIKRPAIPGELSPLPESVYDVLEAGDVQQENGPPPKLYVSHNGETLETLTLNRPRLLVGRSEHNQLRICSRFISRHHALFVRHGNATFLMDLNSTNGTFVNSRRISNLMLKNDDIVLMGNHCIKFVDPSATERSGLDDAGFTETMVMKNLEDIRQLLAREQIRMGTKAMSESQAVSEPDAKPQRFPENRAM